MNAVACWSAAVVVFVAVVVAFVGAAVDDVVAVDVAVACVAEYAAVASWFFVFLD